MLGLFDAGSRGQVAEYNAEAKRVFDDWQPQCPNWRPVAVVLGPEQVPARLDLLS